MPFKNISLFEHIYKRVPMCYYERYLKCKTGKINDSC